MKVSELKEFGLIDLLAKMVGTPTDNRLLLGIGDDSAAWYNDASAQLATVDTFIQDVHFSLDTTSHHELGWKALATNLSDIAAMGGIPKYMLVSLALPGHTEVEMVTALYGGMIELAKEFEVIIVGGDTSSAPLVVITITVLGSTGGHGECILTRSGAQTGDKVAVTGCLGAAAAGLEVVTKQLPLAYDVIYFLKQAFLHPFPRIAEGQLLVEQGVKTAIDISDGLVSDLTHICQASQVSARIEIDRLPIPSEVKTNFGIMSFEMALSGGEDLELLFTASAEVIAKVRAIARCPVTVIGEIVTDKVGEVVLIDSAGNPCNLGKGGWEHFASK
ncbi:thiamine-phosphate kinase [Chloroflexota bacterium]